MGILCANASRFIQIKKLNKNILLLAFLSICYDFYFYFLFIYNIIYCQGKGAAEGGVFLFLFGSGGGYCR